MTSNALKRRTAGKDMVVYKVSRRGESGDMISYFQKFEYVPQKIYSICGDLDIYGRDGDVSSISEGFHSYSGKTLVCVRLHPPTIGIYRMDNICKFLQTYNNFDDERDIVIVRCIIPEGYAYYENEDGEIVSDGISVTEDYISCGKLRDYMRKSIIEVFTTIDKLFDLLMTSE